MKKTLQTMLSPSNSFSHEDNAALLQAVNTQDLDQIENLLKSSKCPQCASPDILDHAFLKLVTDYDEKAIAVLKLLLKGRVSAVSHRALYSVLSLMRLVNMDALHLVTELVCQHTQSYDLKGTLLQVLIHFKLPHLVEILVNSGLDLNAFWDGKFDMRDSIMCATNVDKFTRDRLLPPDTAPIFIRIAKSDDICRQILRDILSYDEVDKTVVKNLLMQLMTAGYKPNNEELQAIEKKNYATAFWYTQLVNQTEKSNDEKSNLKTLLDMKGFPEQLKVLLFMDIYRNKQQS